MIIKKISFLNFLQMVENHYQQTLILIFLILLFSKLIPLLLEFINQYLRNQQNLLHHLLLPIILHLPLLMLNELLPPITSYHPIMILLYILFILIMDFYFYFLQSLPIFKTIISNDHKKISNFQITFLKIDILKE